MKQNLIVGCGITGITLARRIAEEKQEKVLIIDKKNHIGGNCYDYYDEGICIHKYGTHIFHTDNENVWNFLSTFTKWHPYMHKVKAVVEGIEIPVPFNINSIEMVFPSSMSEKLQTKLIEKFGFGKKVSILELKKCNDKDLEILANYIYNNIFLNYTLKQWGVKPEDLDPLVTGRVPVYISKDNRYFQNRFQGIPLNGYTEMMKKILNHPLIEVKLNTDYKDVKELLQYDHIYYTGAIDEYFNYKFGELPYRSINLDFQKYDKEFYQSNSVINYPNNYSFTRIGEYKYFLNDKSDKTIVSFEYPEKFENGKNERYYPIINEENLSLYQKYLTEAQKDERITFLGRLGDYKYYDMDKAIERVLNMEI
ncbi:UDP-galactopyranose mutase [bacterium]|nr:UDP-galactopyranose mutase [bacterium]